VDGDQGRRLPDQLRPRRIGRLRRHASPPRAIRRISAAPRCTCVCRPATRSTSTPRCDRRC
jgi:hypothetical protein